MTSNKHTENIIEQHSHYGTLVARIGIGLVFLWFGVDKFIHVTNWIGWIPDWMARIIPISLIYFMYLQGAIEAIIGILMIVGYKVRFASLVAVITLFGVEIAMIGTGQTEMMLRDGGLLAASLSLFFTGSNCLSIDNYLPQRK